MDTLLQDLRFGFRMLVRAPAFATVAILTLAIGIGSNTTIFSVINAVLLSPLPFPDSNRLVAVESKSMRHPEAAPLTSYPDFLDWEKQTHAFENIAAYHTFRFTVSGVERDAISVPGVVATASLLSVLKAAPKFGRGFLQEEDQPSRGNVVLLSDGFWRKSFGSDPNIVGKTINFGSRAFTVIGVMPADFNFPVQQEAPQVWTTIAYDTLDTAPGDRPVTESRGTHYLHVIGRLRPDVSLQSARVDLERIVGALNQKFAGEISPRFSEVVPLIETVVGDIRPALMMLFAAVGMVLLIACSNVSNLLFARLAARQREISIRAALGAGSGRIIQQIFTESLLMSVLGGVAGLALAWLSIRVFSGLHPANLPRVSAIALDGKVLVFAIAVMFISTVFFGIVPAWRIWRSELAESIKEGGYSGTRGKSHRWTRQLLIITEVALTLILLTSTTLVVQSLIQLRRVNLGFNPNFVLSFDLSIPANRYNDDQLAQFYRELLPRLEKLPGVRSSAAGYPLPLTNDGFNVPFDIVGRPTSQDQRPRTGLLIVSPGYFHTMKVAIKQGRDFEWQDSSKSIQVVVVNSALVRRFFPDQDPLGKYIKLGLRDNDPVRQIVGVTDDVKSAGLDLDSTPEIYVPFTQLSNPMTVILRTDVPPMTLADAVRHEVAGVDSAMAIFHVRPLEDYVSASTLTPRFNTLLLSLFAGIGLVLTSIGLYGVISQTVVYRLREIGIRMALGARRADVLKLILKEGAVLASIGIMIGIPAALMTVRLITSMLFKVKADDPMIYLEVAIFLLAVALFASYVPARRAMKVDPVAVLK